MKFVEFVQVLKIDAVRYRGGVISSYLRRPLFRVVFWYRIVCYLKKNKYLKIAGIIPYLILRHLEYKYGVFLNTNIHIGSGLYIEHGGCIYLNAEYIGENFSVFHEVTLGTTPGKGKPYVGDDVTIYMGAKVVGNVKLNNKCIIGANAVVTKDVQEGKTVAGIPAKEI